MEGNKEDVSDLIVQGGSEGAHDQGSRISAISLVLSCDPSPGSFPKLPALVVSELRYQWARLGCQPKMLNIELSPLAVSPRALLREGQVTVTRTGAWAPTQEGSPGVRGRLVSLLWTWPVPRPASPLSPLRHQHITCGLQTSPHGSAGTHLCLRCSFTEQTFTELFVLGD